MTTTSKRPSWNPWPVSIIAFFVVALIGCGTFVAYCNRHPADLVAADYYEQEVRYQGQIDRTQQAQQQADRAAVAYDSSTKRIQIHLPRGSASDLPTGTVQLYRPAAINLDRQLKLATDAQGTQNIDATGLAAGLWKVRVSWKLGQNEYFIDEKVVINGS